MTCIEENTVVELLHGQLPPARLRPVQSHLGVCSSCRGLLSELTRQVNGTPARSAGPLPWDPRPEVPPLAAGSRVGRYLVLEPLGAGGMGVVYAAQDPVLDRKVALKLIHTAHTEDPAGRWRSRLLQEARAIARLSHPNVVSVYDVGSFGDQIYVAMELVEGASLRTWLAARPRSWREVVTMFGAAARGLSAAHGAGLAHRDFKPDNVLVGHDGRVRVMDFGLARWLGSEGPEPVGRTGEQPEPGPAHGPDARVSPPLPIGSLTVSGTLVGTPGYIAPEVLLGHPADCLSDQFSFCVALHEALYGRRPVPWFLAGTGQTPADARSRTRVPGWLRRAVLKGLEREPLRRHASMAALATTLERGPRRRVVAAGIGGLLAAIMGGLALFALPDRPVVRGRGTGSATPWAVCACDTRSDGWGVRTWYWTEGGGHDYIGDANGSKAGCGCERSYDGRRIIRIRVCAGRNRQDTKCSADFLIQ